VIRHAAILAVRLAGTAIFLLTWAFGAFTFNAFAFDQFVRAGLSPFLTHFVKWHNLWFGAAFLLTAATLVPIIRAAPASGRAQAARWLSIAYMLGLGAVALWLLGIPHLAMLNRDSRDLLSAPGALLPLLWLAAIDHLAFARSDPAAQPTPQRALLFATLATAVALWLLHIAAWWLLRDSAGEMPFSTIASVWALLIDIAAMLFVYAALGAAAALGSGRRHGAAWEHIATLALLAFGAEELIRRIVLPGLGFAASDGALLAVPFGITIAATWSGLRVACSSTPRVDGVRSLLAMRVRHHAVAIALLAVTVAAATIGINQVEEIDWAYIGEQLIAVLETIVALGLILPMALRWTSNTGWSATACIGPPLLAIAALYAMVPATPAIAGRAGEQSSDPQDAIDRASVLDPLARVGSAGIVTREPLDVSFYERVRELESAAWSRDPKPAPERMPQRTLPVQPHVFMFAIDSLRRDYVGAYNPAVAFTPALDAFARDAHVFRNAFTNYGGTWLSVPGLWSGRLLPRGWANVVKDINVIEQLITSTDYDLVINDFTIEPELRKETPRTFLNPYLASPQADMCLNVDALQNYVDTRKSTRPLFTYLGPMNTHILNTLAGVPNDHHPGFNGVYADNLNRVDTCFGNLMAFLKARGIYDDSVIVVTSDHGDMLGEDGRWGHQAAYLFPEIVRVPLIVRLPARLQPRFTTDLSAVTFLTDLAPTLLQLFGLPPIGEGPAFGSSAYVPADAARPDRRRRSFIVMASYGSTYGAVRRNGRSLYVADLRNSREYAYAMGPVGHRRVPLNDSLRGVFQDELKAQVDAVRQLYESRATTRP
jgi:hypothetical protein